jgi:hypothetical protein
VKDELANQQTKLCSSFKDSAHATFGVHSSSKFNEFISTRIAHHLEAGEKDNEVMEDFPGCHDGNDIATGSCQRWVCSGTKLLGLETG